MTLNELKIWIDYIKDKEDSRKSILDNEENINHWMGRLFIGKKLFNDYEQYEAAYDIMKEIYLNNEIRYNRDLFGSYEDYIEEKVTFFKDMAKLNYIITKEAAQSIPFIDEAIIMLDGAESVSPYINQKEFLNLRNEYVEMARTE